MNPRLKKVLGDLHAYPARTLLVVAALALGLWGAGSIMVSYYILSRDLNENFLRARPYHAALSSADFGKAELEMIRARPEVESADFQDLAFLRVEAFPGHWLPLWLFGVEDFDQTRIARLYPQSGTATPPPGTVLLERNGQLVSSLRVDAQAKVRAGSRLLRVPVSGITFDPAQAPATQDAFIYAYADPATYTQISGEPSQRRLILRFKQAANREAVKARVQALQAELAQRGIYVESVQIPQPDQHPHQFQLNTLLALQGGIGLLAFVLGAVLVSQLVDAMLAQQVRQMGVLKAIGATRTDIFFMYVLMVLLLGLLASLIAVPLVMASGFGFAQFVANILNFDILTLDLPWEMIAALLGCGVALPLLFAAPILLRGTRIPVLQSLTDYGIRAKELRDTSRWSALPLHLLLAWRNVLRRRGRMLTMVATIALGVAIFGAGFNVRQSLLDFLEEGKQAMRYDVQVVLKHALAREQALAPFAGLQNVQRIETWSGGRGRLQSSVVAANNGIGIVALPPATDLLQMDVIQGRWLRRIKGETAVTEIVMNQSAAEEFGQPVAVGKEYALSLQGRTVMATLVGIIKEFDVAKIYMDQAHYDAQANPQHLINNILFVAKSRDYADVVALKQQIEKRLEATDFKVLYVMSQTERAKIVFDHLNIILTLFTLLSLLVLVIGGLGMAASMGASVLERTREIGVMRAIGATPHIIYRLFAAEGALISAAGIISGLLLSLPLSLFAARFFGTLILGHNIALNFAFGLSGLAITLLITLAFGWLASRLPAQQAVRLSNREALAYE